MKKGKTASYFRETTPKMLIVGNHEGSIPWRMDSILKEVWTIHKKIGRIFQVVPNSVNEVADVLAKYGVDSAQMIIS